jgi:transitional endoplasmic reticulum ATPase
MAEAPTPPPAPAEPPTAPSDLRLQVAGAQKPDVGKGAARLSEAAFRELGIRPGDPIAITGKKTSAAIALPPYQADAGLSLIRMDGLQRANVGASIGDHVTIEKADVKPAKKVVLAPAQSGIQLSGSGQALLRTLLGRPLAAGDVVSTSVYRQNPGQQAMQGEVPEEILRTFFQQRTFGLQEIRLVVVNTSPRGLVRIAEDTEIELRPEYADPEVGAPLGGVTYDDVGGIGPVVDQVREMVELPLKHPELFGRLGIDPPRGVLLYGPPGTGKTLLARAVAHESDAEFYTINGPEIMGRYYGESEGKLREVFEEAAQNAPAIIFIDELDSIAPKREDSGEVERRIVAQLLTLMDGLEARNHVVVIGATNRPDAIDEALRRPGRFDREIVVGVPDTEGRREILSVHTRGMPLAQEVDLDQLAEQTYGFVGADLSALAREAAIEALRRHLPDIDLEADEIPPEILDQLVVTNDDFQQAVKRVKPSALREIMIQVPNVSWDDIGGLSEAKEQLRDGVELPLKNPEAFRRLGIRQAKGFLLFGPPGTGKTLMAKAVAREAQANFISTKSSDLLSKYYGESEQQISKLFARARQVAPTVIFLDEIDALAPARGGAFGEPAVTERVVNTILAEMDGLEELGSVIVIGATNRPTLLDPALLRPGRFDELVYVPVPEQEGRRKILGIQTDGMPLADDVDLERLAAETEGYTGADLENLARKAGLAALREDADRGTIPMSFFETALKETRASVTPKMEKEYRKMVEELKQESPRGVGRIGFALGQEGP